VIGAPLRHTSLAALFIAWQNQMKLGSDQPMQAPSKRDERLAWGLVAVWICGCLVLAWDALPLPNVGFAQDLGIMVDAGWRFYQGQRTHADYHSALGPLLGMIFGIPMLIHGASYESLTLVPPVVSAVAAFWTCALCRGSLPALPRAAAAVAVGAVSGGIYHLGFPPEVLSFATFYNRVGFGLLAIAMLAALLPRNAEVKYHVRLLDCSTVIATIMLSFLKANFAATAGLFVAFAAVCQDRSRRDLGFVIGVAVALLLLFIYSIGFRVDLMLRDIVMGGSSKGEFLGSYFFPARNLMANLDFIAMIAVYSVLCVPLSLGINAQWRTFAGHMALVWMPLLLGLGITLTQSHGDGRGVVTVIAGLAASLAWMHCPASAVRLPPGWQPTKLFYLESDDFSDRASGRLRKRACTAITLATTLLFILPHGQSYSQWFSLSHSIAGHQFESPPIRKLFVGSFVNNWQDHFPALMNEGCSLLARSSAPKDGVQYVDVSNLFNFAAGRRSPIHSALWWDIGTFSSRIHPAPKSFADTQYLMFPKPPLPQDAVQRWSQIYGVMLERDFQLHDETAHFKLYRRR